MTGIRQYPRHKLVKRVKVKCGSWDAASQLYTHNISRGGMFVRTLSPPPVGSTVEVVVTLPDGSQSALVGEVVRVVSVEEAAMDSGQVAGMGLRFGALEPRQVEGLERLIDLARTSPELEPEPEPEPPLELPAAPRVPRGVAPSGSLSADDLFADVEPPPAEEQAADAAAATGTASSISQVFTVESTDAYLKAQHAYNTGNYADARMIAATAVRADPRNRDLRVVYLLAYARELLAANRKEEGIQQLQAVLKLDYKNQEAIDLLRALGGPAKR